MKIDIGDAIKPMSKKLLWRKGFEERNLHCLVIERG